MKHKRACIRRVRQIKIIFLMCMMFVFASCFAQGAYGQPEGLGDSYNDFLFLIHNILSKICIVSGGALLLGGLAQFKAHRDNPIAVKLSIPVSMVVVGLLLVGLAYLPSPIHVVR